MESTILISRKSDYDVRLFLESFERLVMFPLKKQGKYVALGKMNLFVKDVQITKN